MDDSPLDAVDVLIDQHTQIAVMFSAVSSRTGAAKASAYADLVRLVAIHESVEGQVIHPLARHTVEGGEDIIDARLAEERVIEAAFAELAALGSDHRDFDRRLAAARAAVAAHNAAEESEEFGRLRAAIPADILRDHVLAIRRAESATPSGSAPGRGDTVDPGDSLFDHVKDVLRPH